MRVAALAGALLASLLFASAATAQPRVDATLVHSPPAFLIGHSLSTNWSGYSSYSSSGTFTDVVGSWVQPTATCTNKTTYSSFWVGLDGYNSGSVEQIGTDADCSHGPVYYAWYEMYPNPPVNLSIPVTPGVTFTGEVKYGSGSFTLSIKGSNGASFSTTQSLANAARSSAEWIAEAPSMCAGSCRVLPLTNFGTVNFSGSAANTRAIDYSGWQYDALTMVTNGGQIKAQPSGLSGNGSAFSVTWYHS
jgi:hypothetical protein